MLLAFLEKDPGDLFSRYALGLEFLSEGDHDRAAETFEEVRRRDPNYVALYYQLGKAHQQAGRLDQAREAWREGARVAARAGDWHAEEELSQALESLA
ncbi:MAG TPA: tetratricopeptide repeat protein [Candidatus Nitrosotenuis sp.]|jgi:Tfp pilus assembly protein PilF|nr:tetratricopeptide repeat protein [Candidatus Nitrosotenuis sp.]